MFKLRDHHKEVFGDENPRSYYFLLMKLFDFWEMHPLRPEFVSLYKFSGIDLQALKDKYVVDLLFDGNITGIAPGWHFEPGIHKSWQLIKWLPRDGEIRMPLVVYYGKSIKQWVSGHVYEGHHRSGAANRLGWKTFPALVLDAVGTEEGFCEMTQKDRDEMGRIQEKKGLPNSSRIHGVKIALWTDTELRSFMYPRLQDKTKFGIQNMLLSECAGASYPEWLKFGEGSIVLNAGHGVFKAPEVL